MRVIILSLVSMIVFVDCQFWKYPQSFLENFAWARKGRTANMQTSQDATATTTTTQRNNETTERIEDFTTLMRLAQTTNLSTIKMKYTTQSFTSATTLLTSSKVDLDKETITPSDIEDDDTSFQDTSTQEEMGTTEEPRDNHRLNDFYLSRREKPQVKIASNISQNLIPLPAVAGAALVKPTKYHYYPHNQHIYLLPECAVQQVCNAVYIRLNWTQPLCACPPRYRDPCSASLNSDDQHTTELSTGQHSKALTLVKTCEATTEMRLCRPPSDWSLLALQNIRTGKSHYLVVCRCMDTSILEGPIPQNQPTYAGIPGIRVYGMMCVQSAKRKATPGRRSKVSPMQEDFPWEKVDELIKATTWN
ncbi:hypothetical protein QE152_g22961 [Popillia japonica]|uniref:Uncharacterized protein n=1 Tax=Popillia japonica TaxID=7064 RepID=A0AAW1KIY3_POPJA